MNAPHHKSLTINHRWLSIKEITRNWRNSIKEITRNWKNSTVTPVSCQWTRLFAVKRRMLIQTPWNKWSTGQLKTCWLTIDRRCTHSSFKNWLIELRYINFGVPAELLSAHTDRQIIIRLKNILSTVIIITRSSWIIEQVWDCISMAAPHNHHEQRSTTDYCCAWKRPLNQSSGVVVVREGERRTCAEPPEWNSQAELKVVSPCDRAQYRERKITEWLETQVPRLPRESFANYLKRCYAAAELQLKYNRKVYLGDEYQDPVDRFVFRLFMGARMRQSVTGVSWGIRWEEILLQLLREACVELANEGRLKVDPKLCNYPVQYPWLGKELTGQFELTDIPSQLDTITRMDSRWESRSVSTRYGLDYTGVTCSSTIPSNQEYPHCVSTRCIFIRHQSIYCICMSDHELKSAQCHFELDWQFRIICMDFGTRFDKLRLITFQSLDVSDLIPRQQAEPSPDHSQGT